MQAAFYEPTRPAREVLQLGELPDRVPGAGAVGQGQYAVRSIPP